MRQLIIFWPFPVKQRVLFTIKAAEKLQLENYGTPYPLGVGQHMDEFYNYGEMEKE